MMLLVGITALAQRGEGNHRKGMNDLSPEQMASLQTKKATLALDLTASQQTQMNSLFLEHAQMRKAKMEERKAAKENGEAKTLSSEERYARADQRLDRQIAQKAKLKEILSEEQMEKWEKIQQRRGKHRKGKGSKKKSKE